MSVCLQACTVTCRMLDGETEYVVADLESIGLKKLQHSYAGSKPYPNKFWYESACMKRHNLDLSAKMHIGRLFEN